MKMIRMISFFIVNSVAQHLEGILKKHVTTGKLVGERSSFYSGIWWIFDLITTYLAWKQDDHNCALNFILDTPNLLAGFLIFMVTVFKKSVAMGLQDKTGIRIIKDKSRPSEISTNVTKDSIVDSTSV